MPLMYLNTNLQTVPDDFELKLCQKVSEILNKPMEKITLTMHTGVRQLRAGSPAPMVSLDIYSIGVFDKERNPGYTEELLSFFTKSLDLPGNRVLLLYHAIELTDIGQVL